MNKAYIQFKELQKAAAEELKADVQDKSRPIEERWELFKTHGEGLTKHEIYIYHWEVEGLDDYLINDSRRYSIMTSIEIIEQLEENYLPENNGTNPPILYGSDNIVVDVDYINKVKEEILEEFMWSYEVDW